MIEQGLFASSIEMVHLFVTIGGLARIVLANSRLEIALTWYILCSCTLPSCNFHGSCFALFAGFHYRVGKISGQPYPETLGQFHYWIIFFSGDNPLDVAFMYLLVLNSGLGDAST
ncbi:hypothetical protein BT93_I1636 [Corymbia citriodora subsp. variegata]|nr:hypothetical protein BT93_I1636 [Corymbia citriodora subsp. variegata]KAF8013835.1 hypothetical protein BT93_I1636 [Corymbia citriodora subsp. variegata]KAF8013836.1 hypothetical protein BT93_I1636 [Corymbia citriodora subsp. variegata]